MDLGAGDGAFLVQAAQRTGCRGIGIELDAALVARGRAAAEARGVAGLVTMVQNDMFAAFGSDDEAGSPGRSAPDVIYLYQLPAALRQLEPHLYAWLHGPWEEAGLCRRTVCSVTWPLASEAWADYLDPPDASTHAQRGFYVYRRSSGKG